MFSNLNKPAFGTGSANTSFGFGASTTANPFGGQTQLFGKPAGNAFGSTGSTFGQTTGSSLFPGSQPQTGGLFQSGAPTFGAPATSQTGFGSNVFGSAPQQPAGGGLFGSSAFGQQNKPAGFGFGASTAQPSLFGQTQPAAQQTASPFQPSTSSTLFGGGGSFGATPQQTGTVIKFQPLTSTDTMQKSGVTTTINTKHHCITCMKEYEGKSLEELRWEDYQANRKGPQQPGFGTAPFSSVGSSVPMFGQPQDNKPVFGQTASGFGGSFGIGAQTSASQNIFGKPAGFGATTTTANSFGFGSNTMSSSPFSKPFGTSTSQPLFGAGTQQTPAFGTGMFSQQQNTGLFGKPQTSTAFGTGTPSFSFSGQPASQQSSLFSQSKTSTTFPAFGQTNTAAPAFGQQQPSFGQTSNQPSFGTMTFAKPATGFGQPTQPPFGMGMGTQQSSLFSKPGGGLFGPTTGTTNFFTGNTMQPQTSLTAPQQQPQPLQLPSEKQNEDYKIALNISDQFGQLIQLANIKPEDATKKHTDMSRVTRPEDIEKLLIRPVSPPTTNPMKSRIVPATLRKSSIFDGLAEEMTISSSSLLKPRRRLLLSKKDKEAPLPAYVGQDEPSTIDKTSPSPLKPSAKQLDFTAHSDSTPQRPTRKVVETTDSASTITTQKSIVLTRDDLESTSTKDSDSGLLRKSSDETVLNSTVILTRHQYFTVPSVEELEKLRAEDGKCYIQGFTVGRIGYGNVYFPDKMDVSNLNLDEIVHIRHREVVLYPDDTKKPPVGQGLNRRAQITLDNVYPVINGELVRDPDDALVMCFTENLREVCERKGMRFLEYRPETGSFVFEVEHFSKYGLENRDVHVDPNKYKNAKVDTIETTISDVINQESGYGAEDDIINSFGLGGMSAPDIEMTDLVSSTTTEGDYSHSDYESNKDREFTLPDSTTDDYASTVSSLEPDSNSHSKELNLLKSALYFDDDDDTESETEALEVTVKESESVTSTTPPNKKYTQYSITFSPRKMDYPHHSVSLEPEVFSIKAFFDIPYLQPTSLIDLGIFKGKSAKVGWMQGSILIRPIWEFETAANFTMTDILNTPFKLQMAATTQPSATIDSVEFITNSMNVFREECDLVMDGGVPLFHLTYPHKFVKQQIALTADLTSKEAVYFKNVWGLCWALFGPMRNSQSNRMVYFNKWLKEVVSSTIEETMRAREAHAKEEIMDEIYLNLTGRRVKEAATLALEHKLPQLSLLITSFAVVHAKDLLTTQINEWKKSGAINHINKKILRIYLLLSGTPICGDTNICTDLEWLRAFALHVWYVALYSDPLGTAVELYEKAFKELGYAAIPFPSYYKGDLDNPPYDIMYHLILLFTKKNVILNAILNPATYTNNTNDYRLSWFLLQVFTALKVGTISEHASNYICINFASQLEQLGLWKYAVFVLLFIKNHSVKRDLIERLLHRNLPKNLLDLENKELQHYLVHQLKLPSTWIHSVLADKCRFNGDHCGEFHNLIYAERFHEAQTVGVDHIIPKLIINKGYTIAEQFLKQLEANSHLIDNYNCKAGLLLEVLQLVQTIHKNANASESQLMHYHDQLHDICKRIKTFKIHNVEQSLCIAEISKCCAVLLHMVFKKLDKPSEVCESYFKAIKEDMLQMPPDYKGTDMEVTSSDIVDYFHKPNDFS